MNDYIYRVPSPPETMDISLNFQFWFIYLFFVKTWPWYNSKKRHSAEPRRPGFKRSYYNPHCQALNMMKRNDFRQGVVGVGGFQRLRYYNTCGVVKVKHPWNQKYLEFFFEDICVFDIGQCYFKLPCEFFGVDCVFSFCKKTPSPTNPHWELTISWVDLTAWFIVHLARFIMEANQIKLRPKDWKKQGIPLTCP